MTDQTVSVIIPAYNVEACLARCIDSALDQVPAPLEVIVVDDGSTDATAEVARGYGDRIVFCQQENAGQGAARNAGLEVANGEFVAFLDADDYWLPGFIAVCVKFLAAHDEAVAVNTGHVIKRWGETYIGPIGLMGDSAGEAAGYVLDNFFATWAEHDHVRTGTAMIRRDVIDRAGPQQARLRISQDLEYWGFIATFGPWGFIPQALWVGDSASSGARFGWLKRYRKRRRLCPTVEQWIERIEPRIADADQPGYLAVRGRVAQGYALSSILAGKGDAARHMVAKYGASMDSSRIAKAMRLGHRLGPVGWATMCRLLRMREFGKSVFISLAPTWRRAMVGCRREGNNA